MRDLAVLLLLTPAQLSAAYRRSDNAQIAHTMTFSGRTVLVLHNLGRDPAKIRVRPGAMQDWEGLSRIFGEADFRLTEDALMVDLQGFGSSWLRVRRSNDPIRS